MSKGLLPEHIGPLVDRLRAGDHQAISLPDVAALTEVLMRSLESYFKSIDLTIYAECQSLADYIDDARQEISSLSPDHGNSAGIPRAGLELEAIVQQTESATNIIMESAESIMEASTDDIEAYTTIVNDAVMQIFEACSFQDITGQRISKVVSTLEHVESRVGRLINILGVMENNQAGKETVSEDEALLNGPALQGEGIEQSEIDALLNSKTETTGTMENRSPETDVTVMPAPPEKNPVALGQSGEASSGDTQDIDFTFDGPAKNLKKPQDVNKPARNDIEVSTLTAKEETVPAKEETVPDKEETVPDQKEITPAKEERADKNTQVAPEKQPEATPGKKNTVRAPVVYEQDSQAGLSPKVSKNTTQSDIDALFS